MYRSIDVEDDSSRADSESLHEQGQPSHSANASVGAATQDSNATDRRKRNVSPKRKSQSKKFSSAAAKRSMTERKPKRALSAYNFFFRDERARLAAELDSAAVKGSVTASSKHKNDPSVFTEMGRIVAQRWRDIAPEELEKYKRMADEDMNRYCEEMAEYQLQLARRQRHECEKLKHDNNGKVEGSKPEVSDTCSFKGNDEDSLKCFRMTNPVHTSNECVPTSPQSYATLGEQVNRGSTGLLNANSLPQALHSAGLADNPTLSLAASQPWLPRQVMLRSALEAQRQQMLVSVAGRVEPSPFNRMSLLGENPAFSPSISAVQHNAAMQHRALTQLRNEVSIHAMGGLRDLFALSQDHDILAAMQAQSRDPLSTSNALLARYLGRQLHQVLPTELQLASNSLGLRQQAQSTLTMNSGFPGQLLEHEEVQLGFSRHSEEDQPGSREMQGR